MKNLLRILCVAALLLAVLSCAALADGLPSTGTVYVKNPDPTDRLNLRTEPRQGARSLGKYYSGVAVVLLGEAQNGYVKVRIDPFEGWMDAKYLATAGDVSEFVAMPQTTVTASSANLRAQPSYDADVLETVGKGMSVWVLGVRDDGWLHVSSMHSGFMRADLLSGEFSFHKDEGGATSGGNFSGGTSGGSTGGSIVSDGQLSWPNPTTVYNWDPKTRLNLREKPNSDSAVLGKYYSGTPVTLLEVPKDGWAHVQIGGTATGYMQTSYLNTVGSATRNDMPTPKIQNKGGSGLNLREKPDTSSKSLGLYKNGTQVSVMGVYGGWVHVVVDGKVGYMQADKFDTTNGLTYDAPK